MLRNSINSASSLKTAVPIVFRDTISYNTSIFPLSDDYCGIYFMILCTIFIRPCDLGLRRFDLVWWIKLHISNARTNFEYPFVSYGWISLTTLPSHTTVTGHAPCHVTGSKIDPHVWNPILLFTCHLHGDKTKIKPCYWRKIAVFHCVSYKVYCTCAVSLDLCIGCPSDPKMQERRILREISLGV